MPPEPETARAVMEGSRTLTLDAFEFDSLAWMEFCIAVEEQSGLELTPGAIVDMVHFCEIENWLLARV
jgi:acyl carrier protein